MRNAFLACLLLVSVSGCGATTSPSPSPSQASSSPAAASPVSSAEADEDSLPPASEAPTSKLSPVEQPQPQGGPWSSVGVTVNSADRLGQLTQAPDSFVAFLRARLGVADEAGCKVTSVKIIATHKDGYVYGTEASSCGTDQVVWGIADHRWHPIVSFQGTMPCGDLDQNKVPKGLAQLKCTDAAGKTRSH